MVSVDDCVSLAPDQAMCVQGGSFQADGESLVADGLVVHCLCDCGDVVWQGGMRHGVAEPGATRCTWVYLVGCLSARDCPPMGRRSMKYAWWNRCGDPASRRGEAELRKAWSSVDVGCVHGVAEPSGQRHVPARLGRVPVAGVFRRTCHACSHGTDTRERS